MTSLVLIREGQKKLCKTVLGHKKTDELISRSGPLEKEIDKQLILLFPIRVC